jgi:hypothetical protein
MAGTRIAAMTKARNLDTASIVLFVGLLSWPFGSGKLIPGGPFVSVFGDVIPAAFALIAIWCALPFICHPLLKIKASAMAHIALATALLAVVLVNVVGFYFDPYARGDALGW